MRLVRSQKACPYPREHTKRTGKIGDGITRICFCPFLSLIRSRFAYFQNKCFLARPISQFCEICEPLFLQRAVLYPSPRAYKKGRQNAYLFRMVEETGFEPTASWSRTKRATKLRYSSLFVCYFSTAIIFLQLFSSFIINDNVVLSETTDLRQRLFNKSVKLREAHHSVFVVGNNNLVHASVLMRRQFFTFRDYVFCIETRS